ncbi:MAG TPA: flagellar biosynthesis protein FlhB [Thermodesulfovibrio thiophilus]|uniref:flagellar biosynthesis protein FlhB n=1 Tax=Thermodesulfovibrio thiophilus TaxID=340095 RepID=UPI0018322479|nr:flagellar biosynthesis protein FlhB [Thermodesulfovibrio thiophilus]HHW20804.1 flagellar biosynthesis protein FlhB [Thermodesulfovibrio thiophilus]HQA04474.1 flagellar biosynthesis protein FlhB [Thermodesulfovibrio thiophilus]
MPEELQERTEQATPRRKEKARQKGEVPRSRELTSIIGTWMIFLYFVFSGTFLLGIMQHLKNSFIRIKNPDFIGGAILTIMQEEIKWFFVQFTPIAGVIIFSVLLVHFIQTGFLFTGAPLVPDISKISPLKGLKRLFSMNALFEAIKGTLKLIALGMVIYFVLKKDVNLLPLLVDMDVKTIVGLSFQKIYQLVLACLIMLTMFAGIDFAYQRWQYERNLRMTKQEIKEEFKETEGSPLVRARIRSLQREMARRRMMQEVPKADVVITNPLHFAVCIKYDSTNMHAPEIVAKGANILAERIKEIARQAGIPIYENKPLARALYKIPVGHEIPAALYKAVAAILAAVYKIKGRQVV